MFSNIPQYAWQLSLLVRCFVVKMDEYKIEQPDLSAQLAEKTVSQWPLVQSQASYLKAQYEALECLDVKLFLLRELSPPVFQGAQKKAVKSGLLVAYYGRAL